MGAKFKGNCLTQDNISSNHGNVINVFIVYKLETWSRDLNTDFTLGDSLFGAVKLTKNTDPDEYGYSGYGIAFHARSQCSLSNGEWGKNGVTFGVDNSSSVHTTITTGAKYSINISKSKKKICSSLHHNKSNIFCMLME